MVTCELCGKRVKTAQGLSGHYRFVHQLERRVTGSALSITDRGAATAEQLEQLEYARSGVIAHLSEMAHSSMSLAELADFRAIEAFAAVEAVVAGYVTKEGVPEAIARYEEAKRLSEEARERFEKLSDESNLQNNSDLVRDYWLTGQTDPDW